MKQNYCINTFIQKVPQYNTEQTAKTSNFDNKNLSNEKHFIMKNFRSFEQNAKCELA